MNAKEKNSCYEIHMQTYFNYGNPFHILFFVSFYGWNFNRMQTVNASAESTPVMETDSQ